MIKAIIEYSIRNKFLMLIMTLFVVAAGILAMLKTPLDAIPDLNMTGRQRTPVAGEVPSPINPPPGCSFHPRCPHAFNRCRTERPDAIKIEETHVACHAIEEGRI